jgi:hypothetical protein
LCRERDEDLDFQLWWHGRGGRGLEWGEMDAHRRHLAMEVEEKSEVGAKLMARLYGVMDELGEISGEARGAGDYENAVRAQVSVGKVVEVAARVSGVISGVSGGQLEQRPLAINFDVRKLAENYQRTALELGDGTGRDGEE